MENILHRILLAAVPVSVLMLSGCGAAKPPQQQAAGVSEPSQPQTEGQAQTFQPQTGHSEAPQQLAGQPGSEENSGEQEGQAEPSPELEEIPAAYLEPAAQQGTLEKLEYSTWDSFTYEDYAQSLTKTAWVYLPYGYTEEKEYNIFYLSHGGWSNETTLLGTDTEPHEFKHIVDHAIEDGKMQPLILVALTYNNLNSDDAWDYGRSLQLTNNFHRELVNDLDACRGGEIQHLCSQHNAGRACGIPGSPWIRRVFHGIRQHMAHV